MTCFFIVALIIFLNIKKEIDKLRPKTYSIGLGYGNSIEQQKEKTNYKADKTYCFNCIINGTFFSPNFSESKIIISDHS